MLVSHKFELLKEKYVPELNTNARLFRHLLTGAELLSLENDDENKVFGIVFRTPPEDSTGLPHIMEHSVLCGSDKYPVKEPFVELVKGSLNTFLNAFTYPDKTCYPCASQNLQDFYNLIDVYVDATLHPLIPEHILQQEGWHYEAESADEPLSYRGVVFNEMKGAYSSPDSVLGRYIRMSLFPDIAYGFDSGGDPRKIPDLNYKQFKSFHEKYYHPSNARIFFYGDDEPDERLRRMDAYLQDFELREIDSSIDLQPRFEKPQKVGVPYVVSGESEGNKAFITMNWLLPRTNDPETVLSMDILDHILIATPASPLRKALIDSGLGEDLAGAGLQDELQQMYFATGLKGVKQEDVDKVEQLILEMLANLSEKGIDPDMVAAAVNTVEFRLRENNTGSFPRGLLLMLRSLTTWLYDGDPFAPLEFETPLMEIKESLSENQRYFEELIEQYLLNNAHRTTLVLEPDPQLRQQYEAEERARLDEVQNSWSPAELQLVVANTHKLKQIQETPDAPEALATIPVLKLSDLEMENKLIPLELISQDGSQILYHDLFTNGILYLDVGFDIHTLPGELLPYVPLYGRALLEIGTETEDFVKLSQRIGRSTGGIRPTTFTSVIRNSDAGATWLFLRGKATMEHGQDLLEILEDVLMKVKLDHRERFLQIVLEEKASQESALVPGGHRFVNSRLRSKYNEADWVSEQIEGVDYLFFLRQLVNEIESNWPAVLDRLFAVHDILVNRSAMLHNVTVDAENWQIFQPQLTEYILSLPSTLPEIVPWQPDKQALDEGLIIPAQVNYVGKAANLYQLGYQLDGSILAITKFLRTTWLWERIRVQGGAYGGFCLFDQRSGIFSYLSYRDPNLLGTIKNYDQTGSFLRQLDLSDEELAKSIIGAIGDIDAYQLPDAKGYTSMIRYLSGITDESRQKLRDELLATNPKDFHAFAEVLDGVRDEGRVVVMGSAEAVRDVNRAYPEWLVEQRVL